MRIAKKSIISEVALRYEKGRIWMNPLAAIAVLGGMFVRKKYSSRTEVFFGVPVYFLEERQDLSVGSSLLKGSADLLNAKSPFWAKQVNKVFKSIMVQERTPLSGCDRRDRCWMVNPLRVASPRGERASVILTMELITALCVGLLYEGRCGYFGVKNCYSISARAVARFLRKCNVDGDYSDLLSLCYQMIDKVRPGRHCYERFKLEESRKGRL